MKREITTFILAASLILYNIMALGQVLLPSPDDFIQNLLPDEKAEAKYRSWRGIRRDPAKKAEDKDIPTFNVQVTFEFNSHELTTDGELLLSQLGLALIDNRLRRYTFFLGGHTDAVGSDSYNQELSERRVQTVRNYLIDEFKIAPDNLFARGYGESRLLIPQTPDADANRRVEIKNIGPK